MMLHARTPRFNKELHWFEVMASDSASTTSVEVSIELMDEVPL